MRWIYWLGWMAFGAAFRTLFGMKIIGGENLITEGPVLVASNHESFLDPPLIGNLYQTEMTYLARKTLFIGMGAWLYPKWNAIPVDQDRPDMGSLKTIIRKLKEGERVLVFPEGERTLDGNDRRSRARHRPHRREIRRGRSSRLGSPAPATPSPAAPGKSASPASP